MLLWLEVITETSLFRGKKVLNDFWMDSFPEAPLYLVTHRRFFCCASVKCIWSHVELRTAVGASSKCQHLGGVVSGVINNGVQWDGWGLSSWAEQATVIFRFGSKRMLWVVSIWHISISFVCKIWSLFNFLLSASEYHSLALVLNMLPFLVVSLMPENSTAESFSIHISMLRGLMSWFRWEWAVLFVFSLSGHCETSG